MTAEFNIEESGFVVRPGGPEDAKAIRMLLPELQKPAAAIVAVDGKKQLVIGASAAAAAFRHKPLAGPGIALHVIEPCRRHGVGTALLEHLSQAAQHAGAKALYAAKRVEPGSQEFCGWNWLDFAPCETVEEHVLPISQFEARLGPLVDRMRRQGKIPGNARVVPLYQADPTSVLQLHLAHMGGDRSELHRKLSGQGPRAYLPRQSRVLLIDGRVEGCLLAHRTSRESIVVDANIVEPAWRGGWANAWLKLEAFRGAPPGVQEFRFTSFDHYTDTRSFTSKLGGYTVRTTVLMMRSIAPGFERGNYSNNEG